ncbi:hypothetical protein, partial [Mycobacterium tuberculosis]|uniref:hypothetical protein n=1 Tax=Mycobacterium tuberculosis TaxID=1773 RepID=UPI001BE454F3
SGSDQQSLSDRVDDITRELVVLLDQPDLSANVKAHLRTRLQTMLTSLTTEDDDIAACALVGSWHFPPRSSRPAPGCLG